MLFWKLFILFLSILGIPFKIIFFKLWKYDSLKPYLLSKFIQCRLIEFGLIRWIDLPHLHSFIIHRRIEVEESG